MIREKIVWWRQLRVAVFLAMCGAIACPENCVVAQISPDRTLGAESSAVTPVDPFTNQIDGGATRGQNLFHSFEQFSIPTNNKVRFNNNLNIQNIITRVTGTNVSNIDGLIEANGSANLLLINSNGIIFGANAELNIGGSFIASTAKTLHFADGTQLSTTASQTVPLLTVSVPLGLQFGTNPASIVNRSQASPDRVSSFNIPIGLLQVQPGKTLALVGGDIALEGGVITTEGGRVELGSVGDNSFVGLNSTEKGWFLDYQQVQNFKNIQISPHINGTVVPSHIDTSGEGNASIRLFGKNINISDSYLLAATTGALPPGSLVMNAQDTIELSGPLTSLTTITYSSGNGGDITLDTKQLIITNGAQIFTSTASQGAGGNLTINATNSVELSGSYFSTDEQRYFNSTIASATFGDGNAGDLQINTQKLSVRDGAAISTQSSDRIFGLNIPATGRGGNLLVNASDFVEVSGTRPDGEPSTIIADTIGSGDAGKIFISTGNLFVQNKAEINVSSTGTGNAGNLDVAANSVSVENSAKLTATSSLGIGGGNINLQNLNLLALRNNGEISTSAEGAGNGGNINIDTDNLVLAERSNISARAVEGRGGNISITTQGLFVSPNSTIDATSDRGINGIVEIRRPDVDPSAELVILPADIVDVSGLVAQGCSVGGVASGESSFTITGRGGLPPTPAEATRSESVLVDLGIAEKSSGQLPNSFGSMSRVKVRSQNSKAIPTPAEISNKVNPAPLVEATGWVVGSNGEVVLTASVTNNTLNIPWFRPHRCNGT